MLSAHDALNPCKKRPFKKNIRPRPHVSKPARADAFFGPLKKASLFVELVFRQQIYRAVASGGAREAAAQPSLDLLSQAN